MKKFWLCLGLALIMACWCGEGYQGFGTCPAFGQPYDSGNLSCNPSDPYCYNDYYAAPSADPLSQLLYYVAPPVVEVEPVYRPRQRYERQEPDRGRGGRGGGKEEEHRR